MINKFNKLLIVGFILMCPTISLFAQTTKPIIYAVINDGKTIEPIANIDGKKLIAPVGGDSDFKVKKAFGQTYFKGKSRYKLIFAGLNKGVVKVTQSNPEADCSSNMASVQIDSSTTKLKGFVMGLATDLRSDKTASGIRRLPSRRERNNFTSIIRREFAKKKVTRQQLRSLKYHNLTAIDVDKNGRTEIIGTYWVNLSPTERGLMFMIVEVLKNGKYSMNLSKYSTIKQADVMNQEIDTIDKGVYHELLLDYFDYDNDGVGEIFTMVQGFEGTTFYAYKRKKSQWVLDYEFSNYHCGF